MEKRTNTHLAPLSLFVLAFVACNADQDIMRGIGDAMVDVGTGLQDGSTGDASAQEPQACAQWEARVIITPTVARTRFAVAGDPDSLPAEYDYGTVQIEAGWEPYSADDNGIHIRRCRP